jgi:UDP-N-acetyl-D-glucosamine dehydrogenase
VEGLKMSSKPLTPADIKRYDCLVVTTAHSTFDYPMIVAAGVPIVDARNALKNHPAPHVRKI